MQRRQRFLVAASIWGVVIASAVASEGLGRPSDSLVGFQAMGPAGLKIAGKTAELTVIEEGDSISIVVPLANLKTGIDVRDHHMKEKYLEIEKFPSARLTVNRSELKLPAAGERVASDVPGTLFLHGQTKPVIVHYEVKAEGPAYAVDGKLRLNMKEVGIEVPSYLGVTVKPDVDVEAHFRISPSS